MKRLSWVLAVVAAWLVAAPASATPEFPGLIVTDLNIACDGGASPIWDGMGCTICHTTNTGGIGTVQHPFGAGLKAEGLSAFNDTELGKLLNNEKTALHDFNCDGIPDIEELQSCNWQALTTLDTTCDGGTSTSGDGGAPPDSIVYGCSTTTSPSSQASTVPASLAALAITALLVSRSRRRRRLRPSRSTPH